MERHHMKPDPYDFAGEVERIAAHDARMDNAKDDSGGRCICPYCYQPAMQPTKRTWRCGCNR